MPLVDMTRSSEEKEEATEAPSIADLPDVPWGLRIRLTQAELEKLELDGEDEPDVGDMLRIRAVAEVTSVSKNKTGDTSDCCIELSIVKMNAVDEEEDFDE